MTSNCKNCKLFKRGLTNEKNGNTTNAQLLLMVMEKFNFFKNFKKLLMGGHDEKLKNFGKSKKKGDLYELDNFKQKIFFEKKFQN